MLTLNISAADTVTANYERIHNPLLRIRKRMDVIYGLSQGLSHQEAADRSGVHRNSVSNYVRYYHSGGLEALKQFHYKGYTSVLAGHRVSVETYFRAHPPRTAREAAAKIEELTGTSLSLGEVRRFMHELGMRPRKTGHLPGKADPLKQAEFVHDTLNPLIDRTQQQQCHLFFMDAAHFVMQPYVGILWCFARMFIKAPTGRNRINVLGAIHLLTHTVETLINTTYINANTIAEMLQLLSTRYRDKPLYIVLDNARYQHCQYIKTLAQSLQINLVFLPPYSPNLNLIERLWRYIKKDILANTYYDKPQAFHQAIRQAIQDINLLPQRQRDLRSLITPNFQTFAQNLLE